MPSKTNTLKEEAYQVQKTLQLEEEAFSSTILKITKQFGNLKESWGTGTKNDEECELELKEIERRHDVFFEGRI